MNNLYPYLRTTSCSMHTGEQPTTQSSNVKVLDLLPALSAQACPITIIKENNSTLTKRISYSANLKDRVSFQLPKYVKESSFTFHYKHSSMSSVFRPTCSSDIHNKKDVCFTECSVGVDSSNSLEIPTQDDDSNCTDVVRKSDTDTDENITKDSFSECQQILIKIQQKLNNKMSKSSTSTTKSFTEGMTCGEYKYKKKTNSYSDSMVHLKLNYKPTKHDRKPCNRYNKCKVNVKKENTHQPAEQRKIQKLNTAYGDLLQMPQKNILKKTPKELENSVNLTSPVYRKVFYSEKHSDNVEDIPGVPPCTPNDFPANTAIASLSDIKSQRNIQQKLQDIKNRQLKREKEILKIAQLKEAQTKLVQKKLLMETQRRQIYAINKVLATVEHERFLKYKGSTQGVPV